MTETKAEPFTPAERAVMAARAEAEQLRKESEGRRAQLFRCAEERAAEWKRAERAEAERDLALAQLAETSARLADIARQATAAGPVLEAAEAWAAAEGIWRTTHTVDADEDRELSEMLGRAERALIDAVAALRAAREGER